MKKSAPIILAILLFSSCGMRHAGVVMDEAEAHWQESPDSARTALLALPRRSHWLPWQHARYCLLLSGALDRCGIDVQDDSLARYAATFYDHFGSPVKRFLSQYYLGRVHENRGDRQSAMDAFVKAEGITSDKVPLRFRCALEMHMGAIYSQIYEYERAIDSFIDAADYAQRASWMGNYFLAVLYQARLHISYGDYGKAQDLINTLKQEESNVDADKRMLLRGTELKLRLSSGYSADDLVSFGDSVITSYDGNPSDIPWEDFSKAYVRSGRPEKALDALNQFAIYNETDNNSIYYGLLSEILDSLGSVRGSLDAYKRYIDVSDSLDLIIFKQDTKFLKERHALQTQAIRRRIYSWIIIFLSIAVVLVLLFFLMRRRRENENLKSRYLDLKQEYMDLEGMPARIESISHEASSLLGERLKALSSFFNKEEPASLSMVSTQLETLTENRKELLETIGLLFAVYRPDFVLKLTEKGMTPAETGYCCLIALGMRTAEISKVINREGLFNISSALRRKLGLAQNSTKLGTVLKEMYGNSFPEKV